MSMLDEVKEPRTRGAMLGIWQAVQQAQLRAGCLACVGFSTVLILFGGRYRARAGADFDAAAWTLISTTQQLISFARHAKN